MISARAVMISAVVASLAPFAASQDLATIVAKLASADTLDGSMIGFAGQKSDLYRVYERLRDTASPAELEELAAHESPFMRGYAARALIDLEVDYDWKALLARHAHDTSEVIAHEGCTLARQKFGDYLFDRVYYAKILTESDWLELGVLLVKSDSPLYARERALREVRFPDGMLHEIRALARAGETPAGIALARYGISKDVPVLIEHLRKRRPFNDSSRFLSAEISGDPRLLPGLLAHEPEAIHRLAYNTASRMKFWLRAVAAQKSEPAAHCMLRFLRHPLKGSFSSDQRRKTMLAVLKPYASVEAFAELRHELAR